MKYEKQDISKDGKERTRYWFVLGKSEAVILLAVVDKALKYMPYTTRTQTTIHRLQCMQREIKKAVPDMKQQGENKDDYE